MGVILMAKRQNNIVASCFPVMGVILCKALGQLPLYYYFPVMGVILSNESN